MSELQNVLIDFSEADLGYDRGELEEFLLGLGDEMRSGNLVTDACLAREADIPGGAKPGMAGFISILKAVLSPKNLGKVIGFLGNQFKGKTIEVSYKAGEVEHKITCQSKEDLDPAIAAVERLSEIHIRVQNATAANREEN